jgi:hypothetical protein
MVGRQLAFFPPSTYDGTAMKKSLLILLLSALCLPSAQAHRNGAASELSALSFMPVAVSVAAPVALLSVGAVYTVKAVEMSAEGAVWVLERASDGARASITLAGAAAGGVSVLAGATVSVAACSAGWVLHTAGRAIAIVPNELGRALLHNEQVTR